MNLIPMYHKSVVDWIENTLVPFFNPSQPCRVRLRIHHEFCPTPNVIITSYVLPLILNVRA